MRKSGSPDLRAILPTRRRRAMRVCPPYKLKHAMDPTMRIGCAAALDVDQGRAKLLGPAARTAIADREAAAGELDAADRRQHRGGAAGEGLSEPAAHRVLAPLAERVGLLANLDAHVVRHG